MIGLIIQFLTFIPWILYFIEIMLYRIGVIENTNLDKEKYMKHIDSNLFSSINTKELLLFSIFIIFMQYDNLTVLEILFPTIYIFLLIDFFHTLAKNCKKIKNKLLMIQSVILVIIIIGLFTFTKHLYTTYILMFTVSLFSSFIIYIFAYITKKFLYKK